MSMTKSRLYKSQVKIHGIIHNYYIGLNLSSSANYCGYMVNGGNAMVAI